MEGPEKRPELQRTHRMKLQEACLDSSCTEAYKAALPKQITNITQKYLSKNGTVIDMGWGTMTQ